MHGSLGFARQVMRRAADDGCSAVLQLGDFGYWEHEHDGVEYLDKVSRLAVDTGVPLHFIDGNHENHHMLRRLYGPGGERHAPTAEGFWAVRDHVSYVSRGTRWTWAGKQLMGLGGAYSVDLAGRLRAEAEVQAKIDRQLARASSLGSVWGACTASTSPQVTTAGGRRRRSRTTTTSRRRWPTEPRSTC